MSAAETSRDRETVELFIEESLEALQRSEQLLMELEDGAASDEVVTILFRDFHTIKGSSAFLSLPQIQSLAHAGEDLLAAIRDREVSAKPDHFALLVKVVDVLREMVKCVRELDEEGEHDVAPLLAGLRSAQRRSLSLAPRPAAARPSLVAVPVAPHESPAKKVDNAEISETTVRVHIGVLDQLMNRMGELVLARNQIVQLIRASDDSAAYGQVVQRLSAATSDLQEQIMKTRLQPVARLFERVPRMIRDLTRATGKQVEVEIDGTGTEIDKALVEAVRDPLMHLIRNAVDHGIEEPAARIAAGKAGTGKVRISATHEGGMVAITIQDDGKGMDPARLRAHAVGKGLLSAAQVEKLDDREALELIFMPGFSTAAKVTDISGRGVGMDVVRSNVMKAGGKVELESQVGLGTTVRLKMPLTLAIVPALLLGAGGQRFAIPQVDLVELVHLDEEQVGSGIESVRGALVYRLRGAVLPLVRLSTVLGLEPASAAIAGAVNLAVVSVGKGRVGFIVDRIDDSEEIVVKPLHQELKRLGVYSGATVLGDGSVALILDVAGLAARAGIDGTGKRSDPSIAPMPRHGSGPQPYLAFTAGAGQQCLVPLSMVLRLEQIDQGHMETVAGAELLQYRGEVVPLLRPERVMSLGEPPSSAKTKPVIVFDFGQPFAMPVNRILDVVECEVDLGRPRGMVPFTLGETILSGKTTLILDVYAIARKLVPAFTREKGLEADRMRVLLVDDSEAMRAAIRSFLKAKGFEVADFAKGEDAIHESSSGDYDVVITDYEMSGVDGLGVLQAVQTSRPDLPVIVWTFHDDPAVAARVKAAGARACINKLCREELLAELKTLG